MDKILVPETRFSKEEMLQIEEYAKAIDLTDSSQIMNYGINAQKNAVGVSEAALKDVPTKDFGEVGNLLVQVAGEVKGLEEKETGGIAGFFRKRKNNIETMRSRYQSSEANLAKVSRALEQYQFTLMKDIERMDQMYEQNKEYFKELSMYIEAGRQRLEQARGEELLFLQEKARASGLPEDAQAASDYAAQCDRFEKKLYDMELSRQISLQTAPQIRMIQSDDTMLAEQIQSTLINTIPLWKNQMFLSLGIAHASQAAKARKMVNDATNQMLRQNAETLRQATVMTAEENERGIVDLETLQHTNQELIQTIDEVLRIQSEGHQRRQQAEAELGKLEEALKLRMLTASRMAEPAVQS